MTGLGRSSEHAATAARAGELAASGRIADAYRLLTGPPAADDPEALFMLALWRLTGQPIRRDLAAAREFFRRAAEGSHGPAAQIYCAFVANGTGGAADWPGAITLLEQAATRDPDAAAQLELIRKMRLSANGEPLDSLDARELSTTPAIHCFPGFLTPEECDFLVAQATPTFAPSLVVDPHTGRQMLNPVRTSDGTAFPLTAENPAIHAINRRIAAATGTDVAQGEPLQVLRYHPGQEYKPHFDALPAGEANQRILTALAYLTDGYNGGETLFLSTALRFRGKKGDLLVFRNATPDGRADPNAQHAGLPVSRGVKIIATRWIRARPFVLPPPIPALDV